MAFPGFKPSLLHFLDELAANNQREWFQDNKARYEQEVRAPALDFIQAIATPLKRISPHFVASDRRVGGSLMRIYRDTRFAKDKTPLKTNVGIHLRHEMGKDVHAPGFYVHIAPDECFLGAGLWHPAGDALQAVRHAIDQSPSSWRRAWTQKSFRAVFVPSGDSLKKAPRGYDADHPLVEDLKRKDFIGLRTLAESDVLSPGFLDDVITSFRAARPLMRFLCNALRLPF